MSGVGLLLTASLILNALLLAALFAMRRRTRQQTIQLRRNTARLDDTEARLILALEGADLGFWVWDIPSGRLVINSRGLAMLGYRDSDIGNDPRRWQQLYHPEDEPRRQSALQFHWSGKAPRYECEYRIRHHDGHWVWILERDRIMHSGRDGRPVRMVATFLDISRRKAIEHELYQLAATDSLTGLPNRRVFMERLRQEWAHKQRSPAMHASVVLCDIDHFKTINDKAGDVIVAVNGAEIANSSQLHATVGLQQAGQQITLDVIRDGRKLTVTAVIAERAGERWPPAVSASGSRARYWARSQKITAGRPGRGRAGHRRGTGQPGRDRGAAQG